MAYPTIIAPDSTGILRVALTNLASEPSAGDVTLTMQLPEGLSAYTPTATPSSPSTFAAGDGYSWVCPVVEGDTTIDCTAPESSNGPTAAGALLRTLSVNVRADGDAEGTTTGPITVTGGDAAGVSRGLIAARFGAGTAPSGLNRVLGGAFGPDGGPLRQAGAHPNVALELELNSARNALGNAAPVENVKQVRVELPKGLVGNPNAVPACAPSLLNPAEGDALCPAESQVGVVHVGPKPDGVFFAPVYNVEPPPGRPARFAFKAYGATINLDPSVRQGDYGIDVTVNGISQTSTLFYNRVTLWGIPADSVHDMQRVLPGLGQPFGFAVPSAAPRQPFMTSPTACSGQPLTTTVTVNSWQNPAVFDSKSFDRDLLGEIIKTDGCEVLTFNPAVDLRPSTGQPDAPTGLNVDVDSPQGLGNPDGLAASHLKDVDVVLPEGLTVNPGSADGLAACSDAQLGLGSDLAPGCPEASKLGTVSAKTPLLTEVLAGGVYLRSQNSDDPESGEMFRIALVMENEDRGILVKLPGSLKVNKDTGRISASFKNNPQLPVESVKLRFKTGLRAPLATPAACGNKVIETALAGWSGATDHASNGFDVDCAPGLGGFAPSFAAGVTKPRGGVSSPFTVSIAKPDGNAAVSGLSMVLPTGLVAQLRGNLGAQVGTVKAFAGPGANPFMLPGQVYLEGAYGDAPFSLKVVVPAKAGPFDLGEVMVRQKIYVNPITAQVTVVSDPVPTIVKGVPVRLQRLEVSIDKPDFVINPTSCAAKTISGTLSSAAGQSVPVTNRFQVGECSALDLKPSLALSLSGKGQTTDGKHPAVTANLTQPFGGQVNLKKVRVALPLSLALDVDNANGLCEFVDGSKVTPTCPKASIVGTATAVTPILDEPLSGPVYFVKNVRKDPKSGREIRTLPKLVIPLTGQNGLKLTLTGTSDAEDDQLVTTFDNIPDAPVSSFKLNINGGKGGILTVSDADICKSTQIAEQQVLGQNNKAADTDVFIQTPSCPLKVLSKKVTAKGVTLKVGGLGAGKVTVTGKGIKKTTKTISKSTVATIKAKRSNGTPKTIKVSFLAKGTKKARAITVSVAR
jgi:hypothetical protein